MKLIYFLNNVEARLRIYKLKNFRLHENNQYLYNKGALSEHLKAAQFFVKEQRKISAQNLEFKEKQKLLNIYKHKERKCYNNIGWLWYALGEYEEARQSFRKARTLESSIEDEVDQRTEQLSHMTTVSVKNVTP